MNDLSAKTRRGWYNEFKRTLICSYGPKYYDEIITKLNLQASEEYERSMQHLLLQNQKTQEELYNQKKKNTYR